MFFLVYDENEFYIDFRLISQSSIIRLPFFLSSIGSNKKEEVLSCQLQNVNWVKGEPRLPSGPLTCPKPPDLWFQDPKVVIFDSKVTFLGSGTPRLPIMTLLGVLWTPNWGSRGGVPPPDWPIGGSPGGGPPPGGPPWDPPNART